MNRYLSAISYNLAYFLISSLSFLILTPLAIQIMGGEFFGLWTLLFTVSQFTNIGSLGIGQIVNKLSSEKENSVGDASKILSTSVVIIIPMAAISAGLLCLVVPTLVKAFGPSANYVKSLQNALYISAISIFPAFINKIFQGFFLSQLKNRLVRSSEFITSIFPWLGAIFIASVEKNLTWLSLWNTLLQFFVMVLFLIIALRETTWNWFPQKKILRRMLNYSKFLFVEWSAGAVFQLIDRILVGILLGPTAAGIYSVATSIGLRLPMVTGYATEVMIPYASRKEHLGERKVLYETFRKINSYVSLIIGVLSGVCLLWMHEILQYWISPQYADTNYITFNLVILAYGIISLAKPAHQTLTGLGRVKFTSMTYLFASSLMILGLCLLTKYFGLMGAAIANLIMAILLVMNLYTYKVLNLDLIWGNLLSDLKWGFLIPVISVVLTTLNTSPIIKLGFSLLLILYCLMTFRREPYFQQQITLVKTRLLSRRGD